MDLVHNMQTAHGEVRHTISHRITPALFVILVVAVAIMYPSKNAVAVNGPVKAVATISIIADIARNVGLDHASIDVLVPNDGDPHQFDPRPDDVRKLSDAQLIFANGAGLERFLVPLIQASGSKASIITVSAGLPIQRMGQAVPNTGPTPTPLGISGTLDCAVPQAGAEAEYCDPHLWQNPLNVVTYVENIRDAFARVDPANADAYQANAAAYIAKLKQLDADITASLSAIKQADRQLVTNHDALGYFAARYQFTIAAVVLPGGAAGEVIEPDPQQVARLIDQLKAEKVKALFIENTSTNKLAAQIAAQAGITVVTGLYTDALGEPGTDGDTYIKMMAANAKAIQAALQ
jgi:ABC-type Zn uptake system ZnuABC Zn-binding protein ZnuA